MQRLSVDIAGIPVLRDVIELASGRATYAVVGRNGAGKTTLLRAIMGFAPVKAARSRSQAPTCWPSRRTGARRWASAMRPKTGCCSRP